MSSVAMQNDNKPFGGGKLPFNATSGKVMMWFFLVSDAFAFSTLLISYGHLRFINDWWPDPNVVFNSFPGIHSNLPLMFVSLMTFILIISSVTMVLAVYEGHDMNRRPVIFWLFLTVLGGLAFLGCQAYEWNHLFHIGMNIFNNPFGYLESDELRKTVLLTADQLASGDYVTGPVAFGALFFVITGFHGSHVASGVVINLVILINAVGGTYEKRGHYEMIEKVGLYWHFVDLVWVFVFLVFYLI